jgi:UDP-glucose 4-epimerase
MILIVGGAGYIGSHMVRVLLDAGEEVVVLDNLSTGHRALLPGEEVPFVQGDLGDVETVERLLREFPVDAVMHFAACSLVGESVTNPLKYWENNVARTIALLRVLIEHEVFHFIFSSSAAVYGEPDSSPIPEQALQQPTNPYGATKVAVERALADLASASSMRFVSLRYFNAAGAHTEHAIGEAHEPETHLIPIVLQTLTGQRDRLTVFGDDYPTPDGSCVRDYIHVLDLAEAHRLALEHLRAGGVSRCYNLGNSQGYSVREVIRVAEELTGLDVNRTVGPRRAGDPAELVADSSAIRADLGWAPRYPHLADIIKTAWRWEQRRPETIDAPRMGKK